jgi:predicted N-acetyltransferase YhbS
MACRHLQTFLTLVGVCPITQVVVRPWDPGQDSVNDLTDILHRSYRELADLGFNYWATFQTSEDTRTRIRQGECYLALIDQTIVGTITLSPPGAVASHEWYRRPGVAHFGQFAVDPVHRHKRIGDRLLAHVEQRASELGAAEIALDTAELATHLVDYYSRRGYRIVGHAQWNHATYRSVVMSKQLS